MEEDVLRLDVPVDDAVPVRVIKGARDVACDPHCVLDGQLLLAREPLPQRLPLDVRHDVEEEPRTGALPDVRPRLARVVQRKDVGVVQPGGDLDLAQEALHAERGTELRVQDLDRHFPMVSEVFGDVDGRHAAPAKLALEPVTLA